MAAIHETWNRGRRYIPINLASYDAKQMDILFLLYLIRVRPNSSTGAASVKRNVVTTSFPTLKLKVPWKAQYATPDTPKQRASRVLILNITRLVRFGRAYVDIDYIKDVKIRFRAFCVLFRQSSYTRVRCLFDNQLECFVFV